MTSTDELRKLLDERGVEHDDDYLRLPKDNFNKYTTWGDDDCDSYIEYVDGTVLRIFDCTPEQAISATLGYELNPDELPVGLTISNDGTLLNWRGENYVRQAIAATLGSGTCRWFYPQGANGWLGYAECSNCGYRVYENTIDEHEFVYCPQCGKKVNA